MRRISCFGILLPFLMILIMGCGAAEGDEAAAGGAEGEGVEGGLGEGVIGFSSGPEGEVVQSTKGVAEVDRNSVVGVDAGFAADGVKIDIPTGFFSTECKFTAAVAYVQGSAISTAVSIGSEGANAGLVSCKKVVQEREDVPPVTKGCVASYTVICVDNE